MEQIKHFGIIGKGAAQLRSIELHNKLFREAGHHNYCYSFINIPDSDSFYQFLKSLPDPFIYSGLNVMSSYMIDILPFLSELDPKAKIIGAVNTISFHLEHGVLKSKGYNTDYTAFIESLSHYQIDPRGKTAVILGTGGAAKAVSMALYDLGIESVTFVSTRSTRNEFVEILSYKAFRQEHRSYDMLINCTPVSIFSLGIYKYLHSRRLKPELIYDLVYPPEETEFILSARELGIRGINGAFMLESQIKASHDIWFG